MEDYIDVLLMHLSEQRLASRPYEYVLQERRETQASKALWRTLSRKQKKLFLAYEDERNATASISEDTYARQAFLLAREIFR